MKKLLMACGVMCLLAGLALSVAAPTNFAGTWALAKDKSEGLPPQMADMTVTLTVTQDTKELTVETKREGGNPGGGGPGGGRGMGMMGPQKATYKLNGEKTTVTTETQMGSFTTDYEAKWSKDEKTLELKAVRHINFNGESRDMTTTETWSLSEDGATLTAQRVAETPRGKQESKLVYAKK
jgi:hypothetical protein